VQEQVLELLSARKGHFLLESRHHGDLWLDLESLCLHPQRVQIVAAELAEPLSKLEVDAVCGPLLRGLCGADGGIAAKRSVHVFRALGAVC
jgi:orotate phosphoribosyltransferase